MTLNNTFFARICQSDGKRVDHILALQLSVTDVPATARVINVGFDTGSVDSVRTVSVEKRSRWTCLPFGTLSLIVVWLARVVHFLSVKIILNDTTDNEDDKTGNRAKISNKHNFASFVTHS